MPAKILKARPEGEEFVIQIRLDTAKTTEGGEPDPDFVHETRWMLSLDPEKCLSEALLLAKARLAALCPPQGDPHPHEGSEILL